MRHDNEHDTTPGNPIRILMADGDRNEHLLMTMAADACRVPTSLLFATDGSELLSLLHQGLPHVPGLVAQSRHCWVKSECSVWIVWRSLCGTGTVRRMYASTRHSSCGLPPHCLTHF